MARREYQGGAVSTTITGGITPSTTSLVLTATTGWPTGSFSAVIDPGQAGEEKMLCTSRSGATVTITTRGYDGTVASSHVAGATIYPVPTAVDFDEANALVNFSAATAKTTPVDADTLPLSDSAAAGVLKSLSWANIKATLLTYFTPLFEKIGGYTTTVTSGTPIVLTVSSTRLQVLTGATAQTMTAPDVTTLPYTGYSYKIRNNSTATATFNSSGSNLVISIPAGDEATITCILLTGTTAASWDAKLTGFTTTAFSSATVATSESTTSTTYTTLTTELAVTVVTGTKALVILSMAMDSNNSAAGALGSMGFAVSGASTVAASDTKCLALGVHSAPGVSNYQSSAVYLITGLTAGSNVFTTKYHAKAVENTAFFNRNIYVIDMGS